MVQEEYFDLKECEEMAYKVMEQALRERSGTQGFYKESPERRKVKDELLFIIHQYSIIKPDTCIMMGALRLYFDSILHGGPLPHLPTRIEGKSARRTDASSAERDRGSTYPDKVPIDWRRGQEYSMRQRTR